MAASSAPAGAASLHAAATIGSEPADAAPRPPSPDNSNNNNNNNTTTQQQQYKNAVRKIESNSAHKNYGYPLWRKSLIVFATSWVTLAATFSSTSLFSAADEIAAEFGTTVSAINATSAGVLLAMGFSSFVWGPIGQIFGRRVSYNACIICLFGFTVGAAVAPSMKVFVAMRVLSGVQGTYFHVSGQAILAEYFPPVQRGTATGFFLAGTVLGPPLGPCIAGIIVTFTGWRVILWLQAAMIGLGLAISLVFIPFSAVNDTPNVSILRSPRAVVALFNPMHVFSLMIYPNVFFTHLSCGLLSWSQYALLSAPRHLLAARFPALAASPLVAGLFYISPACGFLTGTLIGGRYSDATVRKWIARRDGIRIPADRLRSGMFSFFLVVPGASLVYGWGLEEEAGGLGLPVAMAFVTAAGLLAAFASLNTYCAEAMPQKRPQVIAGKYCIQYIFAAATSAASVPMIDAIGVGPTSTISVVLCILAGALTFSVAKYGLRMQDWVDERLKGCSDVEKQ